MTVLAATPSTFETMPETMYLQETITETSTSIKLDYVPLAMTAGILILDEGRSNEERVSFNSVTDNGDGTATFGDAGRGLAYGGGTAYAEGGATKYQHTANHSTARLVIAHEYFNDIPFVNKLNVFTVLQTFNAGMRAKTYATKSELDAVLGSYADGDHGFYVTADALFYRKEGGAWVAEGSNATPTATTSAQGKVELGTTTDYDDSTTSEEIVVKASDTISDNKIYTPAYVQGGSQTLTNAGTWSGVTDGEFKITIDGTAYNIAAIDFTGDASMSDVAATIQAAIRAATSGTELVKNSASAFLTGGSSATSVVGTWTAVTDGEFTITIDGTQRNITGIDFSSGVTTMADVASKIQTAIRAATSALETVTWDTDHFVISSVNKTLTSAITVTSAVSGGSGTDISGVGTAFMDCETGVGTVTDMVPYAYTPAYLTGGTGATSVVGTWTPVTDGEFRITIDGTVLNVADIDFSSGVSTMADVAGKIQTAIRAKTSGQELVTWDTDHFVVTSGDQTEDSAITVTSSVSGDGTDISGVGGTAFMDCDTGNGTVTAAVAIATLVFYSGNTTSSSAMTVLSTVDSPAGTDISGAGGTDYLDMDGTNGTVTDAVVDKTQDAKKVVVVGSDGMVSTKFLGDNTASASTFLRGDKKWVVLPENGNRLISSAKIASTEKGVSSTDEQFFTDTGYQPTIDPSSITLAAGDSLNIKMTGLVDAVSSGYNPTIRLYIDDGVTLKEIASQTLAMSGAETDGPFSWDVEVVFRTVGTSATLSTALRHLSNVQGTPDTQISIQSDSGINTNETLTIKASVEFNLTHASNGVTLQTLELYHNPLAT